MLTSNKNKFNLRNDLLRTQADKCCNSLPLKLRDKTLLCTHLLRSKYVSISDMQMVLSGCFHELKYFVSEIPAKW